MTKAKIMVLAVGIVFLTMLNPASTQAYSQSLLMDDQILDKVNALNAGQIGDFLAGRSGPFTPLSSPSPCLSSFNHVNFHWDGSAWHFGDNTMTGGANGSLLSSPWNTAWGPAQISAATIIAQAASQWGINPEVIIATIEKEESLVAGSTCSSTRYNSAMGYDCPDSAGSFNYPNIGVSNTCVQHEKNAGFSRQVLWGAWQLKFNKERSYGNTGWDGDGALVYGGFMTQGTFKRCDACSAISYDGNATIDGQSIHLANGATAGLYSYTPHLGNSTPRIFEQWFGAAASGSALSTPLYRLYKRSSDRHFYTFDTAERNSAISQGYVLEGVSYYISSSGGGDLAPVYRLYKRSTDYHFYTNNYNESQAATGMGFTFEGVGFFASNGGDPGVLPVYRLLNTNGTHFFTINASERDSAVASGSYRYEGIAFFAIPS